MDYQELFYFLGSIYMLLGIILSLTLIFCIVYITKKIKNIHEIVNKIAVRPSLIFHYLGGLMLKSASKAWKSFTDRV